MWLSIKLEPESEKMKIIATKDRDSDSLFYLIPTGMREVCIQLVLNDHTQFAIVLLVIEYEYNIIELIINM